MNLTVTAPHLAVECRQCHQCAALRALVAPADLFAATPQADAYWQGWSDAQEYECDCPHDGSCTAYDHDTHATDCTTCGDAGNCDEDWLRDNNR